MRKKLFASCVTGLLCVVCLKGAYGQECPDQALRNSGVLRFRQQGEVFEIPIRVAGCENISLELRWANGRNNGSNFNVTFFDGDNQAIFTKEINGFLSGNYQFPFNTLEPQPWYGANGTNAMFSVPATVAIRAVRPFAFPASVSFTITRINAAKKNKATNDTSEEESRSNKKENQPVIQGNEIVRIRNAVRLIGSSRVPLVLIELRTSRPFPVRDMPLQMRIGKQVFLNELSGDYTGRILTLSLTPAMFDELEEGAEIVAFFKTPDSGPDTWHFGRLDKKVLTER